MRILLLLAISCVFGYSQAQLVITNPAFPTQDQTAVLYYDANLGNGEVAGVVPVYAHIGVITNFSATETSWLHVVGDWGTADPDVLMSPEGDGVHSFDFGGQALEDFFDLDDGEVIERLAMVFRNVNGSLVGREADGSDIFYDITDGSYSVQVAYDVNELCAQVEIGESVDFQFNVSESSSIEVFLNGNLVASEESATLLEYTFTAEVGGNNVIEVITNNGDEEISEEVVLVVLGDNTIEASPAGTLDGITYLDDTSVRLQIYAPLKDHIFVIGDFNDWVLSADYQMKQTPDGDTFWIEVDGLTPGQEYRFQYHITNDCMRVCDYYAEKLLNKWDDPWIPEETYPGLIAYPVGETDHIVSILQTAQEEFNWTDSDYEVPNAHNLVVYELLIRDFTDERNYQSVIDKLDYLENLNVNAIELMPVYEFEGNESWGYNGSFFFAPDKYYGTEEAFKNFVNECHDRGIAVIMDIALNHSFGQNPQVRMYFDPDLGDWGQPTADSPWFNEVPTHDFNVGYDYNHENQRTRDFCKRVLAYWLEEYHIDGYRMDLTKGFTQNNTLGNIGAWNSYDQSRIDILNDYKNHMLSVKPETIVILEHLANNDEETALANSGFFLWGNLNHEYNEATMGWTSNLIWGSYQQRGWNDPQLVTYMESHDEERLMYKNLLYGNQNGSYNIQDVGTALDRVEMANAFFIPIPGPKMIWQFGELGYDYSINYCWDDDTVDEECRTHAKPVRWDYLEDEDRLSLRNVVAAINHLKLTETAFQTTDFNLDVGGSGKRIHLNHPDMNVCIVGNFDVDGFDMVPGFQSTGTWYDYFAQQSLEVTDVNASMFLNAGEWHIYTDSPVALPDGITAIAEPADVSVSLYPNPGNGFINLTSDFEIESVVVYGLDGSAVLNLPVAAQHKTQVMDLSHLSAGMYLVEVSGKSASEVISFVKH